MAAKTKKKAPRKTSKASKPRAKASKKQSAPKKASKATPRRSTKPTKAPDFAFFGQGDASYFEWFEMWIWFRDPVPTATQAKLVKIAPKLCARDAQWPHPNLLWASTGDQWIHQHLINEYGTKDAQQALKRILKHQEETGDPWDTGDEDEDAAFAGGKELKQFNGDIETWLVAMNELQPILFAARREDGESGGTRLGAWHKKSVAAFEAVCPSLEQLVGEPKKKEREMRPSPISIVIGYVGEDKVSPALAAWADDDGDDGDDDTEE